MRSALQQLENRRREAGHPGVLLQRHLVEHGSPKERHTLLQAAIRASQEHSLVALYSEAFERWTRALPMGFAEGATHLTTTCRLVVGLGAASVLETGLTLHHTYGVPIIPGSALKGLASHYCHEVWGQPDREHAADENHCFRRGGIHHSLLFGTTEDGGVISFHDAWVTPASLREGCLRLDVMTPHHKEWQTNDAPPSDFDSPVPVSFLSAAGIFAICVRWCGPTATPPQQAEAWAGLAMTLLQEALAEWGVGGKTSSGYGRLRLPAPINQTGHVPAVALVARPNPGEKVEAILLEERTKKGGWKALHRASGLSGAIQNTADVPEDCKVGDTMMLIVANPAAFRYPTPDDDERAARQGPRRGRVRNGGGRR